jgi:hypothetical protein
LAAAAGASEPSLDDSELLALEQQMTSELVRTTPNSIDASQSPFNPSFTLAGLFEHHCAGS